MKTVPLTIRRCPVEVHQALKSRAKSNRRSLNNEALTWLEKQASEKTGEKTAEKPVIVTGRHAAKILRQASKLMNPAEHRDLGRDIEAYTKKLRRERLH
jgi:plasmid stability protein